MRWTRSLFQQASRSHSNATSKRPRNSFKSLALSVYFKQPDLGMKDYEILSRATCFLLGVDPPKAAVGDGPYDHLASSEEARSTREFRHHKGYTPAEGGRKLMELGWLEFVPREVRPNVHIVASSHVLSPFLWNDYYPQDWLSTVRQEHCRFVLEVLDPDRPSDGPALAKFGLHSTPYHHPEGRDISLAHFEEEASSLKILKNLGVEILHLRDPEKLFRKGETVHFDGVVVSEPNPADSTDYDNNTDTAASDTSGSNKDEDSRVFYPYQETGTLAFHTEDRFFATTPKPLPEGLCGAPVLDADGDLCGTVEGIVPVGHANKNLAGSAAFLPSFVMASFIDYVERGMVKQMMPPDLFELVVSAKKTNSVGGGLFQQDGATGDYTKESNLEDAYDATLKELKKRYSDKELDSIMEVIDQEGSEVMEIMNKEGGDMDDIMARVRNKTKQVRAMVHDQFEKRQKENQGEEKSSQEA